MECDNMRVYHAFERTPEEAKKTIPAGRLKGMTDINPMYRIKALTERFGPVGVGWYVEIVDKRTVDGANGEVMCFIDLNLYYREDPDGEWSKPVFGTGGNALIARESKGLYANDEGWKMAYTDALSIACKTLGMCADVYYKNGYGKYTSPKKEEPTPSASQPEQQPGKKITLDQIKEIKMQCTPDQIQKLCERHEIRQLSDMTEEKAAGVIRQLAKRKEQAS